MAAKILILNGHPDAARKGLCHGLADAYAAGAKEGGHSVRHVDVGALAFDFVRSQSEFEAGSASPDVTAVQDSIRWADHLVVIFPLWLGDMPALLKAFFEQALRPGFAFTYRPSGLPEMHLKGRSARIIITMGMPAFVYRWYFRAHGLKNLKRNILGFVGYSPVRDTIVGGLASGKPDRIARELEDVKRLGRSAL